MADVFGRVDQVFNGGLTADSLFMTFPDLPAGGLGLLIQNISLSYQQPVRRVFEIGPGLIPSDAGFISAESCDTILPEEGCANRTQPTYYIAARPEGNFGLSHIFGLAPIPSAFYATYGDPCNPNPDVTLSANPGCNGVSNTETQYWDLHGFLITALGMTVTAQEMVMFSNVNGMFVGLDLTP